jgi:aryl carrier-like protein
MREEKKVWRDNSKKSGRKRFLQVLFLFFMQLSFTCVLSFPPHADARKIPVVENAGACFGCHSSGEVVKVFKDKDKMSVFVAEDDFKYTVHSALSCTDCHQKVSLETHPGRVIESRSAFAKEASGACRACHADTQLKAKANHAYMAEKTDAPLCTECHGAHKVRRVSEWKSSLRGKEYCLTCHRQHIGKTMGSGEKLSLLIDPSNLASSVHNKHDCSDCHTEYTRDSHPVKTFLSSREHSISVSGICRQCHADKHMLVKGGVHYNLSFYAGETLVSKGNPKAPVCTDCHGFHMVGPRTTYETLSGIPCRKCHEDVFQIYAKSVHGMARAKGEHRAPLCASCHFAHEIRFTAMTDKIKTACLGCHTGIEGVHKKWLPNAELHLSVVACAACHAPASEKGIYLQLVDQKTERPFTQEQILQLLGTTSEELSWRLNVHGQGLDSYELSYFLKQLNERGAGARVTYLGRMDVSKYSEAHQLSLKKNAIRECESCHRKESKFFKRVTLAVIKTEGGMERYPVEPDVLTSIISTLSSRQFYVLGGTRIAFLDWAGIFVVFCGLLFPVAHITIRVLTAPLRKARKSKVPGKGEK